MNEICSAWGGGGGLRYGEDTTCGDCFNWINYWNTLTTDEKRTEQAAMDAYANEGDRL
jgi:hypothetical protein